MSIGKHQIWIWKKKMFKNLKANLGDQKSSIWPPKVFLNYFKIKQEELVMKDGHSFHWHVLSVTTRRASTFHLQDRNNYLYLGEMFYFRSQTHHWDVHSTVMGRWLAQSCTILFIITDYHKWEKGPILGTEIHHMDFPGSLKTIPLLQLPAWIIPFLLVHLHSCKAFIPSVFFSVAWCSETAAANDLLLFFFPLS